MNLNNNYYLILGVDKNSTYKEIKKKYYKLALLLHPDKNNESDVTEFNLVTEAYNVLCSNYRKEYDLKSKFGNNYNEYYELFNVDMNFNYDKSKSDLEKFKKYEINDISIEIELDNFNGSIEYERLVKCKSCDGSGKDISSKIVIRDNNGNILKTFESDDGCDFCEGSGKDYRDNDCKFCSGKGKIGLNDCKKCNGEKRILGKQKLNNIKLTGEETIIKSMGNHDRVSQGKVGDLIIKIKGN
jgi:molecular chaperone DnaJ